MDMKRLEISRLMDEYQDDEFFPEGGTTADAQAVKERVLAQIGTVKKRRVPSLKVVLLAAALTVGCLLCIAASLPTKVYHLVTGGTVTVHYGPNGYTSTDFTHDAAQNLVVLEDGRIWLDLNGERTDITGLIDAETPYIVESTDPDTGFLGILIVGGTPGDLGWAYWQQKSDDGYGFGGGNGNCYTSYCTIDGEPYVLRDLTEEQWDLIDPNSHYDIWRPWYLNGIEQLRARGINIR